MKHDTLATFNIVDVSFQLQNFVEVS